MNIFRIFAAAVVWYPLFLLPVSVGFSIFYFSTRKMAKPNLANWLTIVLPWMLWVLLSTCLAAGKKSLANLIEPIIIGGVVTLYLLIAVALIGYFKMEGAVVSKMVLVVSCVTSGLIFFLMPGLPE